MDAVLWHRGAAGGETYPVPEPPDEAVRFAAGSKFRHSQRHSSGSAVGQNAWFNVGNASVNCTILARNWHSTETNNAAIAAELEQCGLKGGLKGGRNRALLLKEIRDPY